MYLVGVHLQGSAAMGAFVPTRSDIDVLVVARGPLSAPTKAAVAHALSESSVPCPGVGLENVGCDGRLAPGGRRTRRYSSSMNTLGNRVVDGADHAGDEDLVAHFATGRARGICLCGPGTEDVFAPRIALDSSVS